MWQAFTIRDHIKITEMYSFFEACFDKDYDFSGETHDFWECVYVIDGSICAGGDGRVYDMKKNSIIFHKPLELHKFHIESCNGARLLIFSFKLEGSTDFFKDKVFSLNHEQTMIMNSFLGFVRSFNSKSQPEQEYLHYLAAFETSQTYSQRVISYIYQLFLSLCSEGTVSHTSRSNEAIIFSDAVNYMSENIAQCPDIEKIARHCGVGATSLKRIFTKYSGLGVHKYLLTQKINTASQLIREGVSITEIAERLGFSSQGYFSFVFKRETGVSPTEYKNKT